LKHKITLTFTIIVLLILVYFFYGSSYLGLVISLVVTVYLIILIFGSSLIQFNYFVNSINKGSSKGIAITFDDGPDPKLTPQILDILAKENVKASFFVIGNKIEEQKELLQRIYNEGHTVGNHSFSHTKQLTTTSTAKLKKDIANCSSAIEKIIQHKPLFFRPPFGITSPRYNRAIQQLNMKSIGWNVRSLDTKANDAVTLYNKIIKKVTEGSILLLHDTQKITIEVLPKLIKHCKDNGINIVSLPELINEKSYE
jgi:peptidoglycan/xylan/chitin deacetylase (PgdA/CDA1 family)